MVIQAKSQTLKQAVSYTDNELFETSSQVFYKLIAAKPGDAELLYYMGENFYAGERPDSALFYYEKGLAANPAYPLNYVGKGKVLLANGKDAEALPLFAKAKELSGSKNAEVFIKIADAFILNEKNMPAAIEALAAAEKLEPKNIKVYLMQGDAQLLLDNDGSKAISYYDKAAGINPESPMPNVHTGSLYEKTRAYDLALSEYETAISKDSTYAPAYRQLGYLYFQFNKYNEAKNYYEKYVNMTGGILSAKVTYGKFLFLAKKYPEAIEIFNDVLALDPSLNILNRLLGYSYYEVKQYDQGLLYIQKFLENAPASKNTILAQDYAYLGKSLVATGADSLGAIELTKAIQMDTVSTDNFTDLANAYKKIGKYNEAIATQNQKIARLKAPTINDFFALGQIYYSQGGASKDSVEKDRAFRNADSIFTIVVNKMPDQIIGHVFRARANAGLDPQTKSGLAKPHYEKIIELGEVDPAKNKSYLIEANYYLAYYYYNLKDKPNTLLYIDKVFAIDPNHEQSKTLKTLAEKYIK